MLFDVLLQKVRPSWGGNRERRDRGASSLKAASPADRDRRLWHYVFPAIHMRGNPPGLEEAVRRELRAPYTTREDYFEQLHRVLDPFPFVM